MDILKVRDELEKALKDVSARTGVDIKLGAIHYNDITFTASLKGTVHAIGDKSGEQLAYEQGVARKGGKADSFGKTFTMNGKQYKIVAYDSKAKKYPIIARDLNSGVNYKFEIGVTLRAE